jgi:uncharacterized membrane protein YedE/YeeE
MVGLGIVLILSALPCFTYGLIDLLAPGVSIRWQVAATARHKGKMRGRVGEVFQSLTRVDPEARPWEDPTPRRYVRWIGLFLALIGGLLAGIGITLIAT